MTEEIKDLKLSDLKPTSNNKAPLRVCVYGAVGTGKTTFASQAPKPFIIECESGSRRINNISRAAKSFEDVLEYMKLFLNQEHDYKTLVIDSLDSLEDFIFDRAFSIYKDANQNTTAKTYGAIKFQAGSPIALDLWSKFFRYLESFQNNTGMNIILISHVMVKTELSPIAGEEEFSVFAPKLTAKTKKGGSATERLTEWADIVGFVKFDDRFTSSDKGFKGKEIKALPREEGEISKMYTDQRQPSMITKSRIRIPSPIPFKWDVFNNEINKSLEKKGE